MLVDAIRAAGSVDAIYLDLHGAMVAEHVDDADGELLRRIRGAVGPDLPIVASLDFHANVSPRMAEEASALVSFRTYPHVDMAETGARAARCLHDLLGRPRPAHALEQIDFLMPLTSQSTLVEPMRSLTDEAIALERTPLAVVGLTAGFPASDVAECGPAVYACGHEPAATRRAARALAERVRARESEFALEIHSIEQAIAVARGITPARGRPLILVDTQDNPGAGGNADTMSLTRALIEARIERVLSGIICDPVAAARAREAGIGANDHARVGLALGDAGRRAPARGIPRRGAGRRPFYRHGPVLFRLAIRARADGAAALRRNAYRGREPQATGGGPGHVPAPRRGAGGPRRASAEELRALPGRLRGDGQPHHGRRGAGPQRARSRAAAVSKAASRYPAEAALPPDRVSQSMLRRSSTRT